MKKIWQNPLYKFLLIYFFLFIGWYLFYNVYLNNTFTFNEGLPQYDKKSSALDNFFIQSTIVVSKLILEFFGQTVFTENNQLWLKNTSGLIIGDSCNALPLLAIFVGFIIAYTGKLKNKIIYGLIGCISIFILNCIRIAILAYSEKFSRSLTEFNHNFTFNVIIYGYIFYLWWLWVKKYNGKKNISSNLNAKP